MGSTACTLRFERSLAPLAQEVKLGRCLAAHRQGGELEMQLWTGELRADRRPLLLKRFPPHHLPGADALAANELLNLCALQPPEAPTASPHVCRLLGGLVAREGASAGQPWLVCAGLEAAVPAAAFAEQAAAATQAERLAGRAGSVLLEQRRACIKEVLRQVGRRAAGQRRR